MSEGGLPAGVIAFIVICCMILLGLIIYALWRWHKNRSDGEEDMLGGHALEAPYASQEEIDKGEEWNVPWEVAKKRDPNLTKKEFLEKVLRYGHDVIETGADKLL